MGAFEDEPVAAELARMIDHTLLAPDAGSARVVAAAETAAALGCAAVCLSPSMLPLAGPTRALLADARVRICTVVGFPSGAHPAHVKAFEASHVVAAGADEVDMVVNLGAVADGRLDVVRAEVAEVRAAVPGVLKVIVESALWDDLTLVAVCNAAIEAGADFVKTSTGFSPAGGATVTAVELMTGVTAGRAQVKASGGISTSTSAIAMIAAGATRIGTRNTEAILTDLGL
jgi:deoxyribose-phosphate aldolase